jgi:hypothetical protein
MFGANMILAPFFFGAKYVLAPKFGGKSILAPKNAGILPKRPWHPFAAPYGH